MTTDDSPAVSGAQEPAEERAAVAGRPALVRATRWLAHIYTSYPLRLERHIVANLCALSDGPRTIKSLATSVFATVYGVNAPIGSAQREDAQQAFLQLVQLGAITCRKLHRSDGAWEEVAITPLGNAILADPDDWFDAGHLRRSPRQRVSSIRGGLA